MELNSIIDALTEDQSTEKTASADQPMSNRLEQALDDALSMDKTASVNEQGTPSGDLVKIAQRLADAEQLALIKEAELYGAAVCDGFLARMNEHEASGTKVASFAGGGDVDELLVKQAMELGYRETTAHLENLANQAFASGYNETMKTASHQGSSQEAEKIASEALQLGYAEGQAMIKQAAEDKAMQGYQHALNILGSLAG